MDIALIFGIILVISALSCKTAGRIGLPVLVGFILIGVFIGRFYSFEDMKTVGYVSNFALLIIIFTGGFQTNFAAAKPVLAVSAVLSIGGTLLTAGLAFAFAFFVLNLELYPALLLGVIISSTDVASVFSVLRSKQAELKHNLGSVLEIESGSNEPFAHTLTIALITLAVSAGNAPLVLLLEIGVGAAVGITVSKLGQLLINHLKVDIDGIYGVMLCGVALLIYGTSAQFGGSGFMAVYIGGIILGNGKLVYKGSLSRLYSALSMLSQIVLFIMLGMLCAPASVIAVMGNGLLFALFLFFAARPLAVFALMKPFKRPLNEIALVSWAGFRGASSIVFATHLLSVGLPYAEYVFSMVFFVCILSSLVQSPFIIPLARKLKLIDD